MNRTASTPPAPYMIDHEHARPRPDERDAAILAERAAARDRLAAAERAEAHAAGTRPLPLVGDWLELEDGTRARVAHVWPGMPADADGPATRSQVQPTAGGSFCLGSSGHMSVSGRLDRGIDGERIEPTGQTAEAGCWFFHHDRWTAHNAVHARVLVPVWRVRPAAPVAATPATAATTPEEA